MGLEVFDFGSFTGKVKAAQAWSETHTHGGGETVYFVQGAQVRRANPSYTRVVERRQLFLERDGVERRIDLVGWDIAATTGNDVTVTWATHARSKKSHYLGIRNHATGQTVIHHAMLKSMARGLWGDLVFSRAWLLMGWIPGVPVAMTIAFLGLHLLPDALANSPTLGMTILWGSVVATWALTPIWVAKRSTPRYKDLLSRVQERLAGATT